MVFGMNDNHNWGMINHEQLVAVILTVIINVELEMNKYKEVGLDTWK